MEADIYPKARPELADLISGSIGEYSTFHNTFKYYADGVGPDTATLPAGWETRLIRFSNENTHNAVASCLDPLDLAYSKLAAGREKDLDFVGELCRHHLIKPSALLALLEQTVEEPLKKTMLERWQVVRAKKRRMDAQSIKSPGIKL